MSTIDRLHGYLADHDSQDGGEAGDGAEAVVSASPEAATGAGDGAAADHQDTPFSLATDAGDAFIDHFKIRMGPQKMPVRLQREFLKEYGKSLAQQRAKERSVKYPVGVQEYPNAIRLQYKGDCSLPDDAYPILVATLFVRVHTPYTDLRFSVKQLPPGALMSKNDDYIFEVHRPEERKDPTPLLVIRDAEQPMKASKPAAATGTPSAGSKREAAQAAAVSIFSQLRGDASNSAKKLRPSNVVLAAELSPQSSLRTRPDLPIPDAKVSSVNGTGGHKDSHRAADADLNRQALVRRPSLQLQGEDVAPTPWPQPPSEANLPVVFLGLLNALEALGAGDQTKWRFWLWALDGRGVVPWCERRWYCWQDAATDPEALRVAQEVFTKQDALLEQGFPGAAAVAVEAAAAATLPTPPPMPECSSSSNAASGPAHFQHHAALSTYATQAVKALAEAGLLSTSQRNDLFNKLDLNDPHVGHMQQYVAGVVHPGWQAGDVLRMLWGLLCVVSPSGGDAGF